MLRACLHGSLSSVARKKTVATSKVGVAGQLSLLHCTDEVQIGQNSCLRLH